jgi:hypothetical protein
MLLVVRLLRVIRRSVRSGPNVKTGTQRTENTPESFMRSVATTA